MMKPFWMKFETSLIIQLKAREEKLCRMKSLGNDVNLFHPLLDLLHGTLGNYLS